MEITPIHITKKKIVNSAQWPVLFPVCAGYATKAPVFAPNSSAGPQSQREGHLTECHLSASGEEAAGTVGRIKVIPNDFATAFGSALPKHFIQNNSVANSVS